MDFVGGALPNVMFLVGIIAIGVGLGLEFKIIEVKGTLSRTSRYGALGVGGLLVVASIFLYMRGAAAPTATTAATPSAAAGVVLAAPAAAPSVIPAGATTTAAPTTPPAAVQPSATSHPAMGSTVTITGIVQQMQNTKQSVTLIVNNSNYILPQNWAAALGKQLRVGVPIAFRGQYDANGAIVVVTVTQLNNQVVVLKGPEKHSGDQDQGDD
jgi:hypothetical protein